MKPAQYGESGDALAYSKFAIDKKSVSAERGIIENTGSKIAKEKGWAGMAKHTTYFFSEDAKAQAEFYVRAFGGEIVSVQTYGEAPGTKEEWKDKVIHMHLIAGGVNFYMCDSTLEPVRHGNCILQNMEFATTEEAQAVFDKLAEGGTIRAPLKMEFWGALHGQIEDKFGVLWMITTEANATNPS